MNITFFIGNGFDLNLGLKTDYKSFYGYYTKKCPNDMLANAISADYKLWADLEIGLGKYLAKIDDSHVDKFLNSKALLEYHLSLYLTDQMKKMQIKSKIEFVNEFKKSIGNFYMNFPLSEQKAYKQFLNETSESIVFRFVNFNYTDTLDRMIESFSSANSVVATHISKNTGYNDMVALPIHIHGTVNSIILGLNDEKQIKNDSLHSNNELLDCIIKEKVNDALGEMRTETVKEIMGNSKYICIFGMSIGFTDDMWWIAIIEWLLKDSTRKLVLFVYNNSTVQSVSAQESVRLYGREKTNFINKRQSLDDTQIKDIKKRIIIVKNPNIFNFKSIEIKEDLNGQAENDE